MATSQNAHIVASLDAVGQAAAVHRGDLSPLDLVEAAINQIERLDETIGAIVHTRFDEARREASIADRKAPFPGVPIVLKDSLTTSQEGVPYFAGSRLLKERPHIV